MVYVYLPGLEYMFLFPMNSEVLSLHCLLPCIEMKTEICKQNVDSNHASLRALQSQQITTGMENALLTSQFIFIGHILSV